MSISFNPDCSFFTKSSMSFTLLSSSILILFLSASLCLSISSIFFFLLVRNEVVKLVILTMNLNRSNILPKITINGVLRYLFELLHSLFTFDYCST